MAIAKFQMPDGRIAKFDVADGTTPEQAQAMISEYVNQQNQVAQPQPQPDPYRLEQPTFLEGVGKGATDVLNGITDLVGVPDPLGLGDTSKPDAMIADNGTARAGEFVGNVAATIPAILIPGAGTVKGASLIGGGLGGLTTKGDISTRLGAALMGATGGALGTIGAKSLPYLGNMISHATAPFSQEGKKKLLSRLLKTAVGDNVNDVVTRLETAPVLVPNSLPTAAEAGQSGGLSAIQRWAEQASPEDYAFRRGANVTARREAIGNIAGDDAKMAAAEAERFNATNPLYEAAKTDVVPVDETLRGLLNRPSMRDAIEKAARISAEQGSPMSRQTIENALNGTGSSEITGEGLHWLKIGLDAVKNDPKTPLQGAEMRALQGTIDDFGKWREANIPTYARAQSEYAAKSKPINQMQIAGALYDKANPPLTDYGNLARETANQYAKALRDPSLVTKNATGFKGATLENTMTPDQLKVLNNVAEDMSRKASADELGRGIGSNTFQNFAQNDLYNSVMLPDFAKRVVGSLPIVGSVGNSVLGAAYSNAEQKMRSQLANALLDPKITAGLMKLTDNPDFIQRLLSNESLYKLPSLISSDASVKQIRGQ